MIIDFHTHIFPDKIAKKTIEFLSEKGGIPPFSDGSAVGLLREMEKAGVDISVTLPVVTAPKQFESINRFAKEINDRYAKEINAPPEANGKRLLSFGGIHPQCEDIERKVAYLAEQGFLGIKLHPDYQETFFDDESYIRILKAAKANDLIVVTHSGVDGGYRGLPVRCTPDRALRVLDKVDCGKLVLAHLGANERAEEVYSTLCGANVYFDTAYILRFTDSEMLQKIIKKHGEDKILFATDSPWSSMEGDVKLIESLGLNKETEEKIFYKNAKALLKI